MQERSLYEYSRDHLHGIECWTTVNDCFSAHFHSSLEFLYVTSGALFATINGQTHHVESHNFLIVPSYSIHSYDTPSSSFGYVLTVPLEQIPSYGELFRRKVFASSLIRHAAAEKELEHCLRAIQSYCGAERTSVAAGIVKGYAYVFLGLMIGEAGLMDIPDSKAASLAQGILLYLQNNFHHPLPLGEIAAHFGYSESRFSHVFNQFFGCTVTAYLSNLRCQSAAELMKQRNLTVTEIALSSGFESTRTFYRAFKACFGCSPKQYVAKRTGDGKSGR